MTNYITPLKSKDSRGYMKKEKEVKKGEQEEQELHRSNKSKRGERDEVLSVLNYFKLIMNLGSVLTAAPDTEFKPSKKALQGS